MHNTDETITAVLANIKNLLTDSSLTESFYESVLHRLDSFGYTLDESQDGWTIVFAGQKVESIIKNECNIPGIPDGLTQAAVDMVCGEFLYSKNACGQLDIEGLDLDGAVSSVKTGDTSVNFDTGTSDSQKFASLVDFLMNNGRSELVCFRKMRW